MPIVVHVYMAVHTVVLDQVLYQDLELDFINSRLCRNVQQSSYVCCVAL